MKMEQYVHNLVDRDTYEAIQNILGIGNDPIPDSMVDAYLKVKCRLDSYGINKMSAVTWVIIAYLKDELEVPDFMQRQIDKAKTEHDERVKAQEPVESAEQVPEFVPPVHDVPGHGKVTAGTRIALNLWKGREGTFVGMDHGKVGVDIGHRTIWTTPDKIKSVGVPEEAETVTS